MTDKIVNEICNTCFHTLPTKIIRNTVGLAGYVYTVQICDDKYVIKISDDKNIISGSTYWLDKIKHLDIPTPKVIAENTSTSPYYFIMTFISEIFVLLKPKFEIIPLKYIFVSFSCLSCSAILSEINLKSACCGIVFIPSSLFNS